MNIFLKVATASIGGLVLQGCGGSSNNANFTSWNDVGASETVRIDGKVKYVPYTADIGTGEVTPGALNERDGQLALTLDAIEMVEAGSVDAGAGSVSFDTGNGDVIDRPGALITMVSADGQDIAFFADPDSVGFNYQTFGGWMTGLGTSGGVIGAGSFGRPSNSRTGEVPTLGTATYVGGAGGVAVDSTDVPFVVVSDATVFVDFPGTSFDFWTDNTIVTNLNTAAQFSEPLLDLDGSGTISGATLTGSAAAILDMSGPVDATFYGPDGQEVGGTFYLTGPDGTYVGAFGTVVVP